jgi:type III secretory pathway component EscR
MNTPASNINPVGASLLGVAIVVAVVIAVPTIFKVSSKRHNEKNQENETENFQAGNESKEDANDQKPSYEVD